MNNKEKELAFESIENDYRSLLSKVISIGIDLGMYSTIIDTCISYFDDLHNVVEIEVNEKASIMQEVVAKDDGFEKIDNDLFIADIDFIKSVLYSISKCDTELLSGYIRKNEFTSDNIEKHYKDQEEGKSTY